MEAKDIIFISGIVVACIWLMVSILCDGKARTYVNLFGVLVDVILFMICQKVDFLAVGVIGGTYWWNISNHEATQISKGCGGISGCVEVDNRFSNFFCYDIYGNGVG